jgi:hypothetical protein
MTPPFFFRDSASGSSQQVALRSSRGRAYVRLIFHVYVRVATDRFWLVFSKLVVVFVRNWVDLKL